MADGHKLSGLHVLKTQKIENRMIGRSKEFNTTILSYHWRCNTARFVHNGSQNISLRTRSVCEWVFASSIYCVTAQRETTFCPRLWLVTKPGVTTMRSGKPLKNGSARNPRLSLLTVSIVSWTNGTLVSTNKEIMCRQYVLHRYCLCTTLQFIIYTCI